MPSVALVNVRLLSPLQTENTAWSAFDPELPVRLLESGCPSRLQCRASRALCSAIYEHAEVSQQALMRKRTICAKENCSV
jgi:hypothetical protein